MPEQSEEKTLPASDKKLRDARRRGQVPHSKDLVSGAVFLATCGYLQASWTRIADQLQQLIDVVAAAPDRPFAQVFDAAMALAGHIALATIAPLAAATLIAAILAGMAATLGPVFATEALQPKLENIDPMQGLKRLVSPKSLIEIAKSLVKVTIVALVCWQILLGLLRPLIEAPACGTACFAPILQAGIRMLGGVAAAVFVAVGLVDLLIQRRLFLHEMRMTRTETTREYKDMEGDPHVRGELRRLRRELAAQPVRTGLRHAVIAVMHEDHVVGLRYVPGETPVPFVVCKGRGAVGQRMLADAGRMGLPIVGDATLAPALFGHAIGHPIRRELFDPVAKLLFGSGLGKAP